LANLMGGDVTLQRTEMGKGSCFRLVLPLIPATTSFLVDRMETQAVSPVSSPTSKIQVHGRILFAEDGLDNQRLISFLLKKAGATIDIADNGQVALELLSKVNESNITYDLLLTDMQMPVMDGYMLASTLRSRGIKMPIIALTAHALSDDRQKCLDAGCDDYLSKPIDKNTLLAVCAKWIAVRR
jgi:CheY-like chemotaxis protein